MLTSLVIHKGNDNNPGESFYSIANELGNYNGSRNNLDRITFWVSQVSLVHDYWKNVKEFKTDSQRLAFAFKVNLSVYGVIV